MKKTFSSAILLALLAALPAKAQNWVYNTTAKTLSRGGTVVSNVTAKGTVLTLGDNRGNTLCTNLDFSASIDGGYTVGAISSGGFQYLPSLRSLVMPSGVTTLFYDTFRYSTNLALVVLNEGLLSIGSQCFRG